MHTAKCRHCLAQQHAPPYKLAHSQHQHHSTARTPCTARTRHAEGKRLHQHQLPKPEVLHVRQRAGAAPLHALWRVGGWGGGWRAPRSCGGGREIGAGEGYVGGGWEGQPDQARAQAIRKPGSPSPSPPNHPPPPPTHTCAVHHPAGRPAGRPTPHRMARCTTATEVRVREAAKRAPKAALPSGGTPSQKV